MINDDENVIGVANPHKKDDIGSFDESHKPTGIKNLYGWQYTSKGSLPGISGNVDLDVNLI